MASLWVRPLQSALNLQFICRVEFHTQDLDSTNKTMRVEEQEAAQHLRDAVASIFSVSGACNPMSSPMKDN